MNIEKLDQLRDCLWITELERQAGADDRIMRLLFRNWPDPRSLRQAHPKQIIEMMPENPARISRMLSALNDRRWQQLVDRTASEAAGMGIRSVFSGDPDYPPRLREISGHPLILYYRGERYEQVFQQDFFVTMIGTRMPTEYGKVVTEKLTADLIDSNVVIISGLARGIDSIAHRAALNSRGLTVAVVGNGPDIPYPPEHADLMQRIADEGVVISEHPPGTPPIRRHFPARNRILSGLADAVAVVEASRKSGTMITAGFAADQGRDVFAVPGNILSPCSQGCNQLIADGAYVLQTAKDLLWRLPTGSLQTRIEQWLKQNASQNVDSQAQPAPETTPFKRVSDILAACPLALSDIAERLDLTIESASVILTGMELDGWIVFRKGRYTLTEAALCSI
jgi:DNA processing protein